MIKHLYCQASASDQMLIRTDLIVGMDTSSSTELHVFHSGLGNIDNNGIMKVTVVEGFIDDVQEAIVNAINNSKQPFIVLADDVNKEYLHPKITGVAAANVK
tara:strand:- start:145 stop:450 length:306 start_codon:yes stop_codon:yes gene_type:complete